MAVRSQRKVTVTLSGDIGGTLEPEAADNASSPGSVEYKSLSSGANTITVPTGATAVTIIKDGENTTSLILKGVTGDTGVRLHATDPDTISLHSTQATFVLTAGAAMVVRLVFS